MRVTNLTIPRRFLKWDQGSKYIIIHVQVQSNCSHWLGTVVYCLKLPEARRFKSESRYTSQQLADPWCWYVFQLSLCWGNINWVSALVSLDQKLMFMDFFSCLKNLCSKISQKNIFDIWEKICDQWRFNIKHDKENKNHRRSMDNSIKCTSSGLYCGNMNRNNLDNPL